MIGPHGVPSSGGGGPPFVGDGSGLTGYAPSFSVGNADTASALSAGGSYVQWDGSDGGWVIGSPWIGNQDGWVSIDTNAHLLGSGDNNTMIDWSSWNTGIKFFGQAAFFNSIAFLDSGGQFLYTTGQQLTQGSGTVLMMPGGAPLADDSNRLFYGNGSLFGDASGFVYGDGSNLTGNATGLSVGFANEASTVDNVMLTQISVDTINAYSTSGMRLDIANGGFKNTNNGNFILDVINGLYYSDSFGSVLSADLVNKILYNNSNASVFAWGGSFVTGNGSGLNPAIATSNSTATATFNTSKQNETIYETSSTLIAALTIALPSTTMVGQILTYVSNRVVTAVTVTGTVVAGPALTTFGAAGSAAWQAVDTSGSFIRTK